MNERPMRIYHHGKKVYFKTTQGGRQLIKVPNGMSNVSGAAGRDLYNVNIQYGPKRAVRGRATKKKPELPLFTEPIAPTTSVRVDARQMAPKGSRLIDARDKSVSKEEENQKEEKEGWEPIGGVPTEQPLPTRFMSANAAEGRREVPSRAEEEKKVEITATHDTPITIEPDPTKITHFNLPTKFDEMHGVEGYENTGKYLEGGEGEGEFQLPPVAASAPTEAEPFNWATAGVQRWKVIAEALGVYNGDDPNKQKYNGEICRKAYKLTGRLEPFEEWAGNLVRGMTGYGASSGDGLSTSEIKGLFKKYDAKTVPVIPCDWIQMLLPKVSTKTKQFYFVMNTAPSTSDGTRDGHWVSWCLDNERKVCYFYNSLAQPARQKWLKDVKKLIIKMDPVHMWVYKHNRVRNQSLNSSDCGFFASHFVHEMMGGSSFAKATFYDHPSRIAEKELKPFIKKWGYL